MQHTAKYSVFMSADGNDTLYGVCGIIEQMGIAYVIAANPQKKKPAHGGDIDTKGDNVPKAMAARYAEISEAIEAYCDLKLPRGTSMCAFRCLRNWHVNIRLR